MQEDDSTPCMFAIRHVSGVYVQLSAEQLGSFETVKQADCTVFGDKLQASQVKSELGLGAGWIVVGFPKRGIEPCQVEKSTPLPII